MKELITPKIRQKIIKYAKEIQADMEIVAGFQNRPRYKKLFYNNGSDELVNFDGTLGMITKEKMNELLLDQLYRFEGVMGMYNCQHGGLECNFQTAFHRLIREEINILRNQQV